MSSLHWPRCSTQWRRKETLCIVGLDVIEKVKGQRSVLYVLRYNCANKRKMIDVVVTIASTGNNISVARQIFRLLQPHLTNPSPQIRQLYILITTQIRQLHIQISRFLSETLPFIDDCSC